MTIRPTSATPAAADGTSFPGRLLRASGRSGGDPLAAGPRRAQPSALDPVRTGRPHIDRLLPWLLAAGWGGLAIFGWLLPASRPVFVAVCVIAGLVAFVASADRGER